jgi:hypothetical protein
VDLFTAQDRRKPVFVMSPEDSEDMPAAGKDLLKIEPNPAIADPHRLGGPSTDVFSMEEVVPEFLFRDKIGRLVVELDKHADSPALCLLGALALAVELQGVDHGLIPVFHHVSSPLLESLMVELLPSSYSGELS